MKKMRAINTDAEKCGYHSSVLKYQTLSIELVAKVLYPEKYEDLVVRVSGFSANYITLEHEVQLDILARTTHERI